MLRIMLLDDIMRQLVSDHNPPIRSSLTLPLSTATRHLRHMQLGVESEIAEDSTAGVECYRAATLVVEDVHGATWESINVADIL